MNSFVYRSNFKDPVEDIFDWHMRPGALERLIPPWEHVEIKKKSGPPSERGEAVSYTHLTLPTTPYV